MLPRPPAVTSALAQFERVANETLGVHSRAPRMDHRVRRVIDTIGQNLTDNQSLDQLAAVVKLSPSRLRHLMSEATGVPLRRLRMWIRVRHAVESFARGASLTAAALGAGFANSAHFSHSLRRCLGYPLLAPSSLAQGCFKLQRRNAVRELRDLKPIRPRPRSPFRQAILSF